MFDMAVLYKKKKKKKTTVISANAFHEDLSTLQSLCEAVSFLLVLVFIISDHAGCGVYVESCLTWWWWVVMK